jgi:hypothetical protein
VSEPADRGSPRIPPDGKQVAAGKRDEKSRVAALWVLNVIDGSALQLTHQARGSSAQPYDRPTVRKSHLQAMNWEHSISTYNRRARRAGPSCSIATPAARFLTIGLAMARRSSSEKDPF